MKASYTKKQDSFNSILNYGDKPDLLKTYTKALKFACALKSTIRDNQYVH